MNILFQALTPIELFRWAKLNLDQKQPRFGGKAGSVKSDSISLFLSLQCTRTTLGPELGECSRYYLKIKHQSLDGSEMIKAFLHVRYCFVPLHASRVMAKYQIQVVEGRERVGGRLKLGLVNSFWPWMKLSNLEFGVEAPSLSL